MSKWLKCWEVTSYVCLHYDFVNHKSYENSDGFEYFFFDFHNNGKVDVYGHFTSSFDTTGHYFFTDLVKQGYSNKKDPFTATFYYTAEKDQLFINGHTLLLNGTKKKYTTENLHCFEDKGLTKPKRVVLPNYTYMERVGDRKIPN